MTPRTSIMSVPGRTGTAVPWRFVTEVPASTLSKESASALIDERDARELRVAVVQDRLRHEEAARAGHPDRPRHLIDAVAHVALRVGHVRLALVDPGARVEDGEDPEHGDREEEHDDDHLDEREARLGAAPDGGEVSGAHGSTSDEIRDRD